MKGNLLRTKSSYTFRPAYLDERESPEEDIDCVIWEYFQKKETRRVQLRTDAKRRFRGHSRCGFYSCSTNPNLMLLFSKSPLQRAIYDYSNGKTQDPSEVIKLLSSSRNDDDQILEEPLPSILSEAIRSSSCTLDTKAMALNLLIKSELNNPKEFLNKFHSDFMEALKVAISNDQFLQVSPLLLRLFHQIIKSSPEISSVLLSNFNRLILRSLRDHSIETRDLTLSLLISISSPKNPCTPKIQTEIYESFSNVILKALDEEITRFRSMSLTILNDISLQSDLNFRVYEKAKDDLVCVIASEDVQCVLLTTSILLNASTNIDVCPDIYERFHLAFLSLILENNNQLQRNVIQILRNISLSVGYHTRIFTEFHEPISSLFEGKQGFIPTSDIREELLSLLKNLATNSLDFFHAFKLALKNNINSGERTIALQILQKITSLRESSDLHKFCALYFRDSLEFAFENSPSPVKDLVLNITQNIAEFMKVR